MTDEAPEVMEENWEAAEEITEEAPLVAVPWRPVTNVLAALRPEEITLSSWADPRVATEAIMIGVETFILMVGYENSSAEEVEVWWYNDFVGWKFCLEV